MKAKPRAWCFSTATAMRSAGARTRGCAGGERARIDADSDELQIVALPPGRGRVVGRSRALSDGPFHPGKRERDDSFADELAATSGWPADGIHHSQVHQRRSPLLR